MTNRSNRKRFGLATVFLSILVLGIVACGPSATSVGTPEPTLPAGWTSLGTVAGVDRSARLLEVLGKLPLSFKDEGVWFADYFHARELAGAPQPVNLAEFLALSEDEREAYQAANRGLLLGPALLSSIGGEVREWDRSLGFSKFSVAVAVSTGEISQNGSPLEAAYMTLECDRAKFRQGLLDLGYVEGSENGVTYYDSVPALDLNTTRSNPLAFIAFNNMRRVVLGERTLATSGVQLVNLLPNIQRASRGEVPSLNDDAAFHSLALSLGGPLSAALMTRSMVLEPEVVKPPRYEKPEDWGDLHQWEALGIGYGIRDDVPWMALSLFYPDPAAAEADAEELTLRMSNYESAIPLMYPQFREEQLAAMLGDGRDQPINAICRTLDATISSDEIGSVLTMRCDIVDENASNMWWSVLLDMRDLGFLLP